MRRTEQEEFSAHRSLPYAMSSQQQQQHKRVAEQQDGEHANASKRPTPDVDVKEERRQRGQQGGEVGQGAEGEGALTAPAALQAMDEPQINVRLSVSHLHCHACVLPLKPPTFKCEAGHAVCGSCRGSHVQACAGAGTYVPCTLLDGIVRDAKVACAYEAYGCTSWVVYHEAPDHHRSCRFQPCICPVPGCGHSSSPARLVEHFSSHHAWPVAEVDYATPSKFAVPGSQDTLVLVGKADGSVFLMSPCALGAATAVSSLVCVRASGAAATAAGAPQYTCNLWAEVAGRQLTLSSMVDSSDMVGGFPAADQGIFLPVPPPPLMIRIDKVGVSAARSRSPSATPPSSLPRRRLLQ